MATQYPDLFEGLVQEAQEDLFSDFSADEQESFTHVDKGALTNRALVMALARLPNNGDPELALAGGGLDEARHLLRTQQEQHVRNQIAAERAIGKMANIKNLGSELGPRMTQTQSLKINTAYNEVLTWDRQEQAAIAMEQAALDKIEDMAARDPVQAKLLLDNLEKGDANQTKRDFQVRLMKLQQLAEIYDAEREQEGWGSWLINLALGLVPTNYNFSRTGIVDAADNGMFDFLTPGSALNKQSSAIWNMPMADFIEYTKEGGPLDQAIRANADDFLFGKFDPSAASDIVAQLTHQSEEDKFWSNAWGAVEVGTILPFRTAINTTRTLATAGARKEAVKAVRETADAIVAEGPEAAARKYGISEKEVINGQSISMVNPDVSTPNFVPLGIDVAARDEAARKALADLPGIIQAERITDPEEIKAAYEALVERAQVQFGRELKDVSPVKVETLADGSNVSYIEVTFGKKEGGGYASRTSAHNAARKLGVPGSEIDEVVETNMRIEGGIPEGYTMKVYHGTSETFEEGISSSGGKLGPGYYLTPDPETASDYAGFVTQPTVISDLSGNPVTIGGQFPGKTAVDRLTAPSDGPNIRPYLINPDKIFGINNLNGYTLDDMRRVFDELGLDEKELLTDWQKLIDSRVARGGPAEIDSQTFIKQLHDIYRKRNPDDFAGGSRALNERLEQLGYDGIAGNMWGDAEIAIFNPKNIYSQFTPFKTIRDVSGQYFVRARLNMPETGFMTNLLHAPTQSWWARMVGTAPRISDKKMHSKAVQAGSTVARMQRIIDKVVMKPFRTLPAGSKELVRQIASAGTNAQRWWTDAEFNMMAVRGFGRPATEKELSAYRALELANDMDYVLRNDMVYKELLIQGFENVKLRTKWNQEFEVLGKADYHPTGVPKNRVYNVSDDTHYNSRNPLTKERLDELANNGYVLVHIKGTIKLPDGTEIKNVLIKKGDGEFSPLARNQLPYAEGGHRLYEADYRYFAKQTAYHRQPDTGTEVMKNPNTFVAARSLPEAQAWVDVMNKAIRAYRDNKAVTALELEEQVFRNRAGFPSGDEFLQQVKSGHINTRYDMEAVFDRELPSQYTKASPSAVSYMDLEDLGGMDYLGTTGRKFYSGKGEALKDTTGELAVTIDPFDALNTSLRQITRQSGLSNYKIEVFERFMNTYGEYLEPGNWRTPVDVFNNAPIKRGTPKKIADQINAQRSATRTVVGFETPFERAMQDRSRQMAEWVIGTGDSAARKIAHDAVWWWKTANPLSKLRGLAFDAKLGMFNLGQLFIQTSTIASAISLSPKFGMQGAMGLLPMHAYLLSRGSEAVLDTVTKRGVYKSMGFQSEIEFKEYARQMYKSGFMDMNGSHVMVGEYGPSATFGSFGEKAHAVREQARVFFYSAETYNRMVAWRIGYGEALDAGKKVTDKDFWTDVIGRADDYSFNMTHEAASWWQKGLLSIPTQFWAYNVRMMDALLGTRFTPAQRIRLLGMQVLLAGSAGVPMVEALTHYMKNQTGEAPEIDTVLGTLDRGFVDRLWFEMTGANVRLGERLGTGGWVSDVIKDMFGAGEYGEKPFDEIVGGASWSITKGAGGVAMDLAKYVWSEGGGGPLTTDSLIKMGMEISTLGNAHKAMMIANYGMLKSKSGTIMASDLPSQTALFVAMGFNPQETEDLGHMMNYLENKEESIKEAAKIVRNWRQEAFTNPDLMEENMGKVSAFMQLQRPEDRLEILKQTNRITDPSLYSRIEEKYNQETLKESVYANGETD